MKDSTCIGIFDSGLGGISVMRELIPPLPNQDMIYYADSGNCPYGDKGSEWIIARSLELSEFLISCGANMIVVACNTATTAAIEALRQEARQTIDAAVAAAMAAPCGGRDHALGGIYA